MKMLIKVVRNSGRSIPSSSIIFRCLSSVENQGGKMSSFEQQAKADGDNLMRFYMAVKKVSNKKIRFPEDVQAEHERIAREYNRQCRIRMNQVEKDLADKIWLQQEALRALPAHLLEHAKSVECSPPPADRPWPFFDTPPIKGFNVKDFEGEESEKSGTSDDDDE